MNKTWKIVWFDRQGRRCSTYIQTPAISVTEQTSLPSKPVFQEGMVKQYKKMGLHNLAARAKQDL